MKISNSISTVAIACALAACGGGGGNESTPGTTTPPVTEQPSVTPPATYPTVITPANYTVQDRADIYAKVNANRTACGFSSIKQNSLLDIAAMGHANYLQLNDASGHAQVATNSGFTGIDLLGRGVAAGYSASKLGEIAGTANSGTLIAGTSPAGIVIPTAASTGKAMINSLFSSVYHLVAATSEWTEMGVGYSVSSNKTPLAGETIFYTATVVNFGVPAGSTAPEYQLGKVRSFPCNGLTDGVSPIFTSEVPNPFPGRDFNASPMGTPVYFTSPSGTTIAIANAAMVQVGTNASVATRILNAADDVHKMLAANQAFVIPDQPLQPNSQYKITVNGTADGKPWSEVLTFATGTQT